MDTGIAIDAASDGGRGAGGGLAQIEMIKQLIQDMRYLAQGNQWADDESPNNDHQTNAVRHNERRDHAGEGEPEKQTFHGHSMRGSAAHVNRQCSPI